MLLAIIFAIATTSVIIFTREIKVGDSNLLVSSAGDGVATRSVVHQVDLRRLPRLGAAAQYEDITSITLAFAGQDRWQRFVVSGSAWSVLLFIEPIPWVSWTGKNLLFFARRYSVTRMDFFLTIGEVGRLSHGCLCLRHATAMGSSEALWC